MAWKTYPEDDTLALQIQIRINQRHGGTLGIEYTLAIAEADFLECAKILGQFDELAKRIERERQPG